MWRSDFYRLQGLLVVTSCSRVRCSCCTSWRQQASCTRCCNKIADAQAAVSVNEKKWLVMHMHVQLQLDELHQVCLPFLAILHAVAGTLL